MFFENDRTFCWNDKCEHTECYRHQANVVGKPRYLSLAIFEGTKECIKGKSCLNCKHFAYCESARLSTPCGKYEDTK